MNESMNNRSEVMEEEREIICILCPNACVMDVRFDPEAKEIVAIAKNRCNKGKLYAAQEVFDPRRSVMTVVPIVSKRWKVTSVLTSAPVPKEKIFAVYDEIKKVRLQAPVEKGEVIIRNVCGTGADIIVTRTVRK